MRHQIGTIQGGTAVNVVPQHCRFVVDLRVEGMAKGECQIVGIVENAPINEPYILANAALALFDGGASLVVSQFDEMHAPLARFCRGLERAFLHPVQANIYLTPAGAQGFKVDRLLQA